MPTASPHRKDILEPMHPQAETTTHRGTPSFASTLDALASPSRKFGVSSEGVSPGAWKSESPWNDDGLAEDVATLSYERALRAHSRHRPIDPPIADPLNHDRNDPIHQAPAIDPVPDSQTIFPEKIPLLSPEAAAQPAQELRTTLNRNLKCASVTIRMSSAESAQLRRRAAEAGLTVSAYLRSCTFEAESLRALVRDTLAQLRSNSSGATSNPATPARRTWLRWLAHLWPSTRFGRRIAQA
jgi:hypothetical protein